MAQLSPITSAQQAANGIYAGGNALNNAGTKALGNMAGDLSDIGGAALSSLGSFTDAASMGKFDYSEDGYTVEDAVKFAKQKSKSIGSGVGGAIGATVGSVVPVLGTALGGALGSALGGLAGFLGGGNKARQTATRVLDNREAKMSSILEQKRNAFKENEMLNGSPILQTF